MSAARADKDKAKEHFRKGMVAYDLEKWDEAIREFSAGYVEFNDPVFLYNIAQSHRLAGRPKQAMDFYRKYLARSPDAPNRADVERQIAELKASIALDVLPPESRPAAKKPAPAAAPPPAPVAATPPPAPATEAQPVPQPAPVAEAQPAPAAEAQPASQPAPAAEAQPAQEVPAAALTATPVEPESKPPVWKRWPLWVGVAAGVVVVGGAATAGGVLATQDHTLLLMPESAR